MGKNKGYTLVELIVVMAIFAVIATVISVTFNNLVSRAGQQARSATSQIAGIVGLEMLRTDVAHAGFALPWSYQYTPTFAEVSAPPASDIGIDSTTFGNFSETSPPHAVLAAPTNASSSPPGPYYLVIKSALLALNSPAIGHWGIIDYGASSASAIRRIGDPSSDVNPGTDRLITLHVTYDNQGNETRQLQMAAAGNFSYTVSSPSYSPPTAFQPADASQNTFAYAISDTGSNPLNMPYNRADYYVDFNATKPTSCNPNTGVLYKAVAGQLGTYKDANNASLLYPLLNCVGDMQVAFILDKNNNGQLSSYPPEDPYVTALAASDLRMQLRQVRVYVLAHDGTKDLNFTYPGASILVGEPGFGGRTLTSGDLSSKFGSNWMNYRWKVYSISVNMPNMQP